MEGPKEVFAGRERELEILNVIASKACMGNAESAVILGGNGIGKTTLLNHLYHQLFHEQKDIVPLFYSIAPVIRDIALFFEDYILRFMQQTLAYLMKEPEILRLDTLLLDDIKAISGRTERHWASRIIEEFLHVKRANNPMVTFQFAVTTPIRLHRYLNKPIIVLIDNFHEIHWTGGLWQLFESPIRYPYTPHVLTGNQTMLNRILFHEASIGKYLRVIPLKGLKKEDAERLFISLCGNIEYDTIIDKLNGNPFYIRALARSLEGTYNITKDKVMEAYQNEIRNGNISIYWTSHLKRSIPIHLRDKALRLLYHLYKINMNITLSDIERLPFIEKEEIKDIVDSLLMAGVLMEDFSRIKLLDDKVFADFIDETYHKEYGWHTPVDEGHEEIISKKAKKEEVKAGVMERWMVYVSSLLMIIVISVIVYMKFNKPMNEIPLSQKDETPFPVFRNEVIETGLKTQEIIFPTFREEVLKR